MKQTTKAMFNRFKKEFNRLVPILGINGYKFYFFHEKLDNYAEVHINEPGRCVSIIYGLNPTSCDATTPEDNAKHEAIHVLIHRLSWLGEQRFTAPDEINHETEKLVIKLEGII
jgi:hypothetical protein